ncbi:MAG: WD40 repeat domain-containing serine/threonine-protein kinase [Planctomycetota bacterium]
MSDATPDPLAIDALFRELTELPVAEQAEFFTRRALGAKTTAKLKRLLKNFDAARADAAALDAGDTDTGRPTAIGPYAIDGLLGSGGMGIVYLARHRATNATVALKVLRNLDSPGLRKRFRREAEVLSRLDHPGICRFFEVGLGGTPDAPEPFLAMEYVDGVSLIQHAETCGLGDRDRIELVARICDAVDHAHSACVVHRDLKPSNILVVRDPTSSDSVANPVVLDFGVAHATGEGLLTLTKTRSSALIGTVAYMSPEQVGGRPEPVGAHSDIYSVGVLLFELLTGRLPLDVGALPLPLAARMIAEEEPTTLRSIRPQLSNEIETIVTKCLEKDPARRFGSAADLASDLRRYLAGDPITARSPTLWARIQKFSRRHKLVVSVLAALAVGLFISIVAWIDEARARRLADNHSDHASFESYRSNLAVAKMRLDAGDSRGARHYLERAPGRMRGWEFDHLSSQIDQSQAVLSPKTSEQGQHTYRVTYGAGGRILQLFDYAERSHKWALTIHRWALPDWRELAPVKFGWCRLLDNSDDGMVIYVVREDGQLEVCSADDGQVLASTVVPSGLTRWANGSGSASRLLIDVAGQTYYWDYASDMTAPILLEGEGTPRATVDATARWSAGISEGALYVRILGEHPRLWTVPCELRDAKWAFVDRPGHRIAVTGGGGHVSLWQMQHEGPPVSRGWISPDMLQSRAVEFSASGGALATGGTDGVVRVWSQEESRTELMFRGSTSAVVYVSFAPDGSTLASVDDTGEVRVWRIENAPYVIPHTPAADYSTESYVYSVCFGRSGERFYTGSWGRGVRIFDATTARPFGELATTAGRSLIAMDVNFDETSVAVAGGGRFGIQVLDLRTGEAVTKLDPNGGTVLFSPDGSLLAARPTREAGEGLDFKVWNTLDWSLAFHRKDVGSERMVPRFSRDGRFVATSLNTGVVLYDTADFQEAVTLETGGEVRCVAFSPDGKRLATYVRDGNPTIWELDDPSADPITLGGEFDVAEMAWMNDRLFCACMDGRLRVYDSRRGADVVTLLGHSSYIYSIAADPEGARILTGSGDATARIWDTQSIRDRRLARDEYADLAERYSDRVDTLLERYGVIETIARLRRDTTMPERDREVASQLCVERALRQR